MNPVRLHETRAVRSLGALAAIGLLVAACSGTASPAPATSAPATMGPESAAPATMAPESAAPAGACKPEEIRLVGQVRSVSNPYEASWLTGGDFFAASVNLTQDKLTYDADSQKQASQIRTLLATGDGKCTVMNLLPNGESDTPVLVKAADDAGAWLVTQWNKPAEMNPADHATWIAHITYDDATSGYNIAKALFDKMGGNGNVAALQGILDTTAAKDRYIGLQKALGEYPDIKLLDQQAADFDRTKALAVTKTWLTKFGNDLNGIWAANDDMGLGALQALKADGKEGTVPIVAIDAVPDGVQAVKDGNFVATVSADGYWQGGIGLAMGYCAATGQLDVAGIPPENRAFYAKTVLIDSTNVDKYLTPPTAADYASEWACDNLFNRMLAPIPTQ